MKFVIVFVRPWVGMPPLSSHTYRVICFHVLASVCLSVSLSGEQTLAFGALVQHSNSVERPP